MEANVQIDELYVHDLIVEPQQIVKIGTSEDFWLRNSFSTPINFDIESERVCDAIYYGDVYSDALMALRQLSDSWWSLQQMVIWPEFIKWSQSKGEPLRTYWPNDEIEIKRFCDNEASNGVIGVHIDTMNEIDLKNVRIDNLINMASFSKSECGENNQNSEYEANYVRAINSFFADLNVQNLNVSNILSFSGPSYGIYAGTNAAFINLDYAKFSHIDAGIKAIYDDIDLNTQYLGVNSAATSCSVYCANEECFDSDSNVHNEEQCMNGHVYCKHIHFIHHIAECPLDATYTTPIGTLLVRKNGQIKANLFEISNGDETPFVFRGEYFALTIVIILALLMAIKCIYFKSKTDNYQNQRSEEEDSLLYVGGNNEQDQDYDYDAIIIY